MSEYTVLARRFRPKKFESVVGQSPTVTTLKHALKHNKVAQAYLFCGTRGTGKTTLARLFAMALNCSHLDTEHEPCGKCPSCLEISRGEALDVLEIDGASHRGIEDIRQINESIHFSPTRGKYKIYLIDEVHMLTKEAFNALLKTLEEPPSFVKFFFATTEIEKIPATILSRCQKFQLRRIEEEIICEQMAEICHSLSYSFEKEALQLIAQRAEGSLRDALSLLDQLLAFEESHLTQQQVRALFGLSSKELIEKVTPLVQAGNYRGVFELVHELLHSGSSPSQFLQELLHHFRSHLRHSSQSPFSEEVLVDILHLIMEAQGKLKQTTSERITLEMTLMGLIKRAHTLSYKSLIEKLEALEKRAVSPAKTPIKNELPKVAEQATFHSIATKEPSQKKIPPPPTAPPPKKENTASIPKKTKSIKEPSGEAISQSRMDTLMHFTARELGGAIKKSTN